MSTHYGDTERVIHNTGVTPMDLGMEDDDNPEDALSQFIQVSLEQISSVMDSHLPQGHVADGEDGRSGLDGIAEDRVEDAISLARVRRDEPVIQIDDFAASVVNNRSLLRGIKRDIRSFSASDTSRSYHTAQVDSEE